MVISLFIKTDAAVNPKYILIISHTSLTFSDEKSVGALKKCKTFVGQKMPSKMLRFKTCCNQVDRLAYNLLALKTWKGCEKKTIPPSPITQVPLIHLKKGQNKGEGKKQSGVGNVWSLYVSGNLPTYPSPKPTFCHKWQVSVNVGLREG